MSAGLPVTNRSQRYAGGLAVGHCEEQVHRLQPQQQSPSSVGLQNVLLKQQLPRPALEEPGEGLPIGESDKCTPA